MSKLGYRGNMPIHRRQIAGARAVLGPDVGQLRFVRELVDAYQLAVTKGAGAIRVGDVMVDHPMVEHARAGHSRNPYAAAGAEILNVFWTPLSVQYLFTDQT